MRTNVVLDDQLLEEARALSGIKTKKEVVEKALQLLISHEHKKRVLSLRALMRAAADKLETDYQPGGELTEFTTNLDGERKSA